MKNCLILNRTKKGKPTEPFKGLRLHPLKGKLKGFWSVDVTGNYRIIFRFESKNAYDLDLLDTH